MELWFNSHQNSVPNTCIFCTMRPNNSYNEVHKMNIHTIDIVDSTRSRMTGVTTTDFWSKNDHAMGSAGFLETSG